MLLQLSLAFLAPLLALTAPAHAQTEATAAEPREPLVLVGDPLRQLALPLDETTLDDLRRGRWEQASARLDKVDASGFDDAQRGDLAFLRAWCLVHSDKGAQAADFVDDLDLAGTAPPAYVDLVRGEVLLANGDAPGALAALQGVPEDAAVHVRAAVAEAEVLRDLSRTREAWEVYERLVERPDPVNGNSLALLALAKRYGPGSDEAYPYLRRIRSWYPYSEESGEAGKMLSAYSGDAYKQTWQEAGIRAERLMYQGDYSGAINLVNAYLNRAQDDSVDSCRYRYVLGRCWYKRNKLTEAVKGFGDAGTRCVNAEGEYGQKSLYLQGTAEFRRGRYTASAQAYRQLVDGYPEHSMADDALTRGGISLQEAEDVEQARAWWREGLEKYPDGDTVPEATWRLAFSHYLEGDPDLAIEVATALSELPLTWDAPHVEAGRYWAARWKLYPDVDNPTVAVADPTARQQALDEWAALVQENPWSFYSILAWSRLAELDPQRAESLSVRSEGHQDGSALRPWRVRLSLMDDPTVQRASDLARLGLIGEAKAEFALRAEQDLLPEEMAWWTELRIISGDWLYAHDAFRQYIKSHPIASFGERRAEVVRTAWPERYWEFVRDAAKDDRYEARLFHALVREESNFNRQIVSHAGARGLSQLMPATAKQTAGWLGMQIQMSDLNDPATNLKIGARYLDAMHKEMGGSPYLALASYNAGAGRQRQWLGEWGNVPTDEYVERIPYRETRNYVKRVMGTFQTMRWFYDTEDPGFWDLSEFNHKARPDKD